MFAKQSRRIDYQKELATELSNLVEAYSKSHSGHIDPKIALNDPEWIKLREAAKKLIPVLFPEAN